jgi:HK97 family phage prohead protease
MITIERRSIDIEYSDNDEIATRSGVEENGQRYIMGYFALTNSNSRKITERINGNLVTFTERIHPDAFKEADMSTIVYTVEHDLNRPIARTGANLDLKFTDKGLFARAVIPAEPDATSTQNDLLKNINQKIIRSNSFAFGVKNDSWERIDGELYRSIDKISRVLDITSTISPAYESTYVFTRSLSDDQIKEVTPEQITETKPELNEIEKDSIDFEFLKLKGVDFS